MLQNGNFLDALMLSGGSNTGSIGSSPDTNLDTGYLWFWSAFLQPQDSVLK